MEHGVGNIVQTLVREQLFPDNNMWQQCNAYLCLLDLDMTFQDSYYFN